MLVRVVHPLVIARRTLFASPLVNLPSAKKAASKPTQKSAKSSQDQKSATVEKLPNIPKNLKPPKRAPSPFALFLSNFYKSQPKPNSRDESQQAMKRASEIWRDYSIAEKQPFYDEQEARKKQAKEEREEFFRNTSVSDLKHLNSILKARGKRKCSTIRTGRPGSPFTMFYSEFRNTPDAQALIKDISPEKSLTVRTAIAAGVRWRSLSPEEKEPFFERSRKARKEFQTEQAES